jgi:hypothetical protein
VLPIEKLSISSHGSLGIQFRKKLQKSIIAEVVNF